MRRNALTMVGDIERCWLFVYRVPLHQLIQIMPEPLKLVTKGGFGFLNIVVSELAHMRPKGLPAFVGLHYWHVAYRLHARFDAPGGERIEGLYFLRSDADKSLMVLAGNRLTSFQFHHAKVSVVQIQESTRIDVSSSQARVLVELSNRTQTSLTLGSPFKNVEEAKAFLKYKPAGLSVVNFQVDVLRISRDEKAWKDRVVQVDKAEFDFLHPFDADLELCYEVDPIHYQWNSAERFLVAS